MGRVTKDELLGTGGLAGMNTAVRRDGGAVVQEKGRADGWEGGKYGMKCEELVEVELQAGEWVRWRDDDGRGGEKEEGGDGMDLDSVGSLQDAYPCGQR